MRKSAAVVMGAVAVAGLFLSGGCSVPDAVCSDGEYPVKAVGTVTGGACAPNGEEPPAGYVAYPSGKEPQHVGDRWDEYWSSRVLDANGQEIPQ